MSTSRGDEDEERQRADDDIEGRLFSSPPILQRPLPDQHHRIRANRGNLATLVAEAYKISSQAEIGHRAADLFENHRYARHCAEREGNDNLVNLFFAATLQKVAHTAPNFYPVLNRWDARKAIVIEAHHGVEAGLGTQRSVQ